MFRIAEGSSLSTTIASIFGNAIRSAYPAIPIPISNGLISQNGNRKLTHDYQCNAAMSLFKKIRTSQTGYKEISCPKDVAQTIVDHIPQNDIIDKCAISGPGFINIHLNKEWVSNMVGKVLANGCSPPPTTTKRIVIDYSSPNIAKDMHVGHLRSTIIGDCLSRALEFCGHDILRINHVGDWGTQFGMLIAHLQDISPNAGDNPPSIQDLTTFYKQAKIKFDEDSSFQERAHQAVVRLQQGEERNIRLWKSICSQSEQLFKRVYSMLGIDFRLQTVGESFYNPLLGDMVNELISKGLVKNDNGAKVLFPRGFDTPLILQKHDGGYGYDSTDMAALKYRIQQLKADWVIYVVDSGQSLHFKQLFAAAREVGWATEAVRLDHVGFGVVQGEDKKRFKTRSGTSVRLEDLLKEARKRAGEIIEKRVEEGVCGLVTGEEKQFAADQLGYGGVKYFDLRQNRLSDYIFNYDRMLSPDGDTNVYLQYTHARCISILKKASSSSSSSLESQRVHRDISPITFSHPSEWDLACHILRFSDMIELIPVELMPHRICNYVYELCVKTNSFYRDCRVLGSAEENSRVVLLGASERVMRQCFELLGLRTLDTI